MNCKNLKSVALNNKKVVVYFADSYFSVIIKEIKKSGLTPVERRF